MSEPYALLCEAQELLGKAHDKIAKACMDYGGNHSHLVGVCSAIDNLIDRIDDARGACPVGPQPSSTKR